MSKELGEGALDFLDSDPKAKRLVKEMLSAVADHPGVHVNSFEARPSYSGFRYFLGRQGGQRGSAFSSYQRLDVNIIPLLIYHGFAEPSKLSNTPKHRSGFTDAAIEWHKLYGGPDGDEVRKRLGRYFRRQVATGVTPEIKVHSVATELGLRPDEVREQLHILMGAKLLETELIGDNREFETVVLTEPEGILWAESGYPPIYQRPSQTFNLQVGLHVDVRNVIEQARSAEVSPELLEQFEFRIRRVEEALSEPEGEGRLESVKDLVETANHSKDLLGLAIRFLSKHWDKVKGFADAAGNRS